jgi:hypothetical protein
MDRARYRRLLKLAVVLVAGLALGLWAWLRESERSLVIENRSGQPVAALRVTAGGTTRLFEGIPPGGDETVLLKEQGDVFFSAEGKLADGTLIRGQGQVKERSHLVVGPGGQLMVKPPGQGQ